MSKYIPGNQKHLTLEDCKYKECLSQSRAGINITRHELHQEDMVITPLIFQGQSPYQIMTNHPELDISVRTLYSYLDKGILTFFLTREKLFLAFIMNRCTKGTVKLVFNKLERQLGIYDFLTLFNTILTDRGSEFGVRWKDFCISGSVGNVRRGQSDRHRQGHFRKQSGCHLPALLS